MFICAVQGAKQVSRMSLHITNSEVLDFILANGKLEGKDVSKLAKFGFVTLTFIEEHRIKNQLLKEC